MKEILKITLFSILGGTISLVGYKNFIEREHKQEVSAVTPTTSLSIPVNYNSTKISTFPENTDFTIAAEKTIHAVVHVTNTTTYTQPRNIFEYYNNQGEQIQKGSTGSGVVISEDGYIVTNNHVIDNADELTVTLNNQKSYKARVIGFDKKSDIALLKIEAKEKLAYIPFGDSDNVKIGEWVLAVGNPYNLNSTVTAGIISAKSRDLDGDDNIQSYLQTDAVVNPGNSGGALVNTRGELIGINTAISSKTGSYIGYSFAVPSNTTKKIVEDILEYGNVQQAILGVRGYGVNNNVANKLELKDTQGYYISGVDPNSGAAKAGLLTGDIIKQIDDTKIIKSSDLTGFLSTKRPENTIVITILRNRKLKIIPVTLSDKSILTQKAFDLDLKNLTNQEIDVLDIKSGVKVVAINNDFITQKLGITKGCIIIKINEKDIESIDDLKELKSLDFKNLYHLEVIYKNGDSKNWWLR
ncbi:MAG: trypsin-like peptidase domain-containing protein [Flavobacteriaceae bacterium]|nr:trypsin-like peptidase domain-containing protein [Flavobacteriaceae bacterium]